MAHKYYKDAGGGERKLLEKYLTDDKAKNPKKIPYFLSPSKQYPGKFVLAYQPSNRPKFEFISIVPDGYRFRGKVYHSVNDLFKWFKENYNSLVHTPISRAYTYTPSSNITPSLASYPTPTLLD